MQLRDVESSTAASAAGRAASGNVAVRCSECDRPVLARGLCSSHYSVWHRREHGRKMFDRECVVCGRAFSATTADARYCSTGVDSCEAQAKVSDPASAMSERLRNSPLFDPHREPRASEIFGYKRALKMDPCAYCGAPGGSRDHIKPRSAGGGDSWQNLTGACHRCNAGKQSLSLLAALEWLPVCQAYHDLRAMLFATVATPGG